MIPFDLSYSWWVLVVVGIAGTVFVAGLAGAFKWSGDASGYHFCMAIGIVLGIATIFGYVVCMCGYESQATITICSHFEMNGYNYVVDENENIYLITDYKIFAKIRDNTTQNVTVITEMFGSKTITKTDYIPPKCGGSVC